MQVIMRNHKQYQVDTFVTLPNFCLNYPQNLILALCNPLYVHFIGFEIDVVGTLTLSICGEFYFIQYLGLFSESSIFGPIAQLLAKVLKIGSLLLLYFGDKIFTIMCCAFGRQYLTFLCENERTFQSQKQNYILVESLEKFGISYSSSKTQLLTLLNRHSKKCVHT